MDFTEVTAHFHEEPTPALKQFTINQALEHSRYIFYKRVVSNLYKGYCTHCEVESYLEQPMNHKGLAICPNCKSKCVTLQAGRGRGQLVDTVYVEFAEKSLVDPAAITVSGYWVIRDYRESYLQPRTIYKRCAMYIFKQGESCMFSRSRYERNFRKNVKIHSLHNTMTFGREEAFFSRTSLKEAIKGTPLHYSMALQYENHHFIEYLALYCKYPYVEILTKLNLQPIIEMRLRGDSTKSVINWHGKTLNSIIGLPKRDWKHFRNVDSKRQISFNALKHFKDIKATNPNIDPATLIDVCSQLNYSTYILFDLVEKTKMPFTKIFNYIVKQLECHANKFSGVDTALYMYRDFLNYCEEMNVDVTDPRNIFPKDLHAMHQRQIERKKAIADAKLNVQIKKRARELEQFVLSTDSYIIQPFVSAEEITREGEHLNHCVANYARRYAEGQTTLLMVRAAAEPDTPLYTAELNLKDGAVSQVRGYKNELAPDEVQLLVASLLQLTKRKKDVV